MSRRSIQVRNMRRFIRTANEVGLKGHDFRATRSFLFAELHGNIKSLKVVAGNILALNKAFDVIGGKKNQVK